MGAFRWGGAAVSVAWATDVDDEQACRGADWWRIVSPEETAFEDARADAARRGFDDAVNGVPVGTHQWLGGAPTEAYRQVVGQGYGEGYGTGLLCGRDWLARCQPEAVADFPLEFRSAWGRRVFAAAE